MAPGSVHFVFTLSESLEDQDYTIGALTDVSFFLSPHCMMRSLCSSWVDRHLQSQGHGRIHRCDTVAMMLSAFVCDSYHRLLADSPLIGDPQPREVFSAMFMAMMFPEATKERHVVQRAKGIIRHYAQKYPEDYRLCRLTFNQVKAANLSDDSLTAEEVAELRGPMKEAVRNMLHDL